MTTRGSARWRAALGVAAELEEHSMKKDVSTFVGQSCAPTSNNAWHRTCVSRFCQILVDENGRRVAPMESSEPKDVRIKFGELIHARLEVALQESFNVKHRGRGSRVLLGLHQFIFGDLFNLFGLEPDSLVPILTQVPVHGVLLGPFGSLLAGHLLGTCQQRLEIALLQASLGYPTE